MARIRAFFRANIGQAVNGEQLFAASGIRTYARRVRELRQSGWDIHSNRDDPSLALDEYRLVSQPPPDDVRIERSISKRLRAEVLDRNNWQCRMCGHGAGDRYPDTQQRVTLHVDHIVQRSENGTDTLDNLRTLCSRCNEGGRDAPPSITTSLARLKRVVRSASQADQREVYAWLKTRLDDRE